MANSGPLDARFDISCQDHLQRLYDLHKAFVGARNPPPQSVLLDYLRWLVENNAVTIAGALNARKSEVADQLTTGAIGTTKPHPFSAAKQIIIYTNTCHIADRIDGAAADVFEARRWEKPSTNSHIDRYIRYIEAEGQQLITKSLLRNGEGLAREDDRNHKRKQERQAWGAKKQDFFNDFACLVGVTHVSEDLRKAFFCQGLEIWSRLNDCNELSCSQRLQDRVAAESEVLIEFIDELVERVCDVQQLRCVCAFLDSIDPSGRYEVLKHDVLEGDDGDLILEPYFGTVSASELFLEKMELYAQQFDDQYNDEEASGWLSLKQGVFTFEDRGSKLAFLNALIKQHRKLSEELPWKLAQRFDSFGEANAEACVQAQQLEHVKLMRAGEEWHLYVVGNAAIGYSSPCADDLVNEYDEEDDRTAFDLSCEPDPGYREDDVHLNFESDIPGSDDE